MKVYTKDSKQHKSNFVAYIMQLRVEITFVFYIHVGLLNVTLSFYISTKYDYRNILQNNSADYINKLIMQGNVLSLFIMNK